MEPGGLELVTQLFDHLPDGSLVAVNAKQTVDGKYAKPDGFHVEGGDSAPQGLSFLENLFAMDAARQSVQRREQAVENCQRGGGAVGHDACGLLNS
jgi:hypothetical protein